MDDEKKSLFIQQKINLLSGNGEDRGDYARPKTRTKKRDNLELRVTKTGSPDSLRYEEYGNLAKVVDLNRRSQNQRPMTGTGDPENAPIQKNKPISEEVKSSRKWRGMKETEIGFAERNEREERANSPENTTGQRETLEYYLRRNMACGLKQSTLQDRSTFETIDDGGIMFKSGKTKTLEHQTSVPKELTNRIRASNILHLAKQANDAEMHDPKKCKYCCEKEEEIAKFEFLKRRKTKLESESLDKKVDDVIYTTDTIFMIGDIARTLPKPSDDDDLIWQKLLSSNLMNR